MTDPSTAQSSSSSEQTQTDSGPIRAPCAVQLDTATSEDLQAKRKQTSVVKERKRFSHTVSLSDLIQAELLTPGKDVLSLIYKGVTQLADLNPDGSITASVGGHQLHFESPSGFSIYVKRLLYPGRKADDGWKSVKYNSQPLDKIKRQYHLAGVERLGENNGQQERSTEETVDW